MKVLILQENGRHEKNKNFRECFSLQRAFIYHGYEADVWGLGHDNYKITPDWYSYDLIINLEQYDSIQWVPRLKYINTKKFLWSIDAHCKGIESYLKIAEEDNYDMILQSTPEFVTKNSIWLPNCYDDDLIQPFFKEKTYDIGFCGNILNRRQYLSIIESNFNFKLDEFVIGEDMVNAINSYKVHFNANISIDINYRNFETIGCGTCLLTSNNIHYSDLGFIDMENCLIYNNKDEMIEKIKFILSYEESRKNIEKNAIILAKNHTYKNRVKKIMELL